MSDHASSDSAATKIAQDSIDDVLVESRHSLRLAGQELAYTVTTGTLVLKQEAEKDERSEGEKGRASIFFIAYTRDDTDLRERPLTFSFNGGPGSSSVWMHLGLLGPKRVLMDDEGLPLAPPYRLVDNDYTLLTHSDLVFIDPVGTGYSRMLVGEETKQFHGYKADIESLGDFIRLYCSRYSRWTSPKYLIGESYGTTRAGGLSGYLQDRHGLELNGIMLISSVLDFQTLLFTPGNDLPYVLFLPTYAATAWYHKVLPQSMLKRKLKPLLKEVEDFAMGEYAQALFKGTGLKQNERQVLAQKLFAYTGLDVDYLEQADFRVSIHRFIKQLRRAERLTVGRLDSRFTGVDRDAAAEHSEYDPSLANITGPYTATLNDYVRQELGFESDLPYEILTSKVRPWSYKEFENQYLSVSNSLRKAMSQNPHLRVYVASGYYDLATPYFATDYTLNHLMLAPSLASNISLSTFEAGHMMYIQKASLARLKDDLAAFVSAST